MNIEKAGKAILTVDDWHLHAGPKAQNHWKSGRSAFESANAWCGSGTPGIPGEIQELLDSHPDTAGCAMTSGTPELRVAFDRLRGEPRNTDFAGLATHPGGALALSIEAKADEEFGEYIGDILADAADRSSHGESTNVAARIADLLRLLPSRVERSEKAWSLRYQLLTALGGALSFARDNKARAVLVIHEFQTPLTTPDLLRNNQTDLDRFIRRLSSQQIKRVENGKLLGPFVIANGSQDTQQIPLYVGRATRIIAATVT